MLLHNKRKKQRELRRDPQMTRIRRYQQNPKNPNPCLARQQQQQQVLLVTLRLQQLQLEFHQCILLQVLLNHRIPICLFVPIIHQQIHPVSNMINTQHPLSYSHFRI